MRWIAKWAFRLLILLVVLAVAGLLVKDSLLKSLVESRFRTQTGLHLTIGRFELGLFTPTLTVETCRIYQPPEAGGAALADIPEVHAEYDRAALWQQRLHLRLLRLRVTELNLVGTPGAPDPFAAWKNRPKPGPGASRDPGIEFAGIDTLILSLNTLRFIDPRSPQKPVVLTAGLTNEIVSNVKSFNDLQPLLIRVLLRAARPRD